MKTADSRTFLVSIPRRRENEKVVEENINKGIKTDCNDQMSVILHLQACFSKKKKKNYLVVHDIDPWSFLTSNLKKIQTAQLYSYFPITMFLI